MTSQEPLLPAHPVLLEPVRHPAATATALIAVNCVLSAVDTWADWHRHQVVEDYLAGVPGVGVSDLVGADNLSLGVGVGYLLSYVAAGVVFLAWLWRARRNAENLSPDGHRLTRGWTIGGWLVPVVNLWFPFRVTEDIWNASRPADVVAPGTPVRRWWFVWIAAALAACWHTFAVRGEPSAAMLREIAAVGTVITVLQCLAGVLVAVVVRQITRWQSVPRWMA